MSSNLLKSFSAAQLKRAAVIRAQIEKLEAELNRVVGSTDAPAAGGRGGKRRFSAATRAKMRLAQKARWAKYRAAKGK